MWRYEMDPYYGIMIDPGTFRGIARKELSGHWPQVIIGVMIYYVFSSIIPEILLVFVPVGRQLVWMEPLQNYMQISYLTNLYTMFLSGTFLVGLHKFIMMFFRKKDIQNGYIFDGFSYYFKTFVMTVIIGIKVALWSLLFIIPGIVALYRYSQAYFILAETPSKSPFQCIEESKYLMANNKGKLFMLDLSFLALYLLASLVQIPSYYFNISGMPALVVVMDAVSYLVMAPVMAYAMTAHCAFFDVLTGHLVIDRRPYIPPTSNQ